MYFGKYQNVLIVGDVLDFILSRISSFLAFLVDGGGCRHVGATYTCAASLSHATQWSSTWPSSRHPPVSQGGDHGDPYYGEQPDELWQRGEGEVKQQTRC